MKIIEVKDTDPLLIKQLLDIWESSVRATHLFLSQSEIEYIKKYVPSALNEIPHLIIAVNENNVPVGFMGIAKQHLEMLRLNIENAKQMGISRLLITCSIDNYASEKTIIANNGVLETIIDVDGRKMKRYWITVI